MPMESSESVAAVARQIADAARQVGVTRARARQIANLVLPAPAIQEAILVGELRLIERQFRNVVPLVNWDEQRNRVDHLSSPAAFG